MAKFVIPRKAVYRLSLYYRVLERLQQNSIETVSSDALARATGVKPTQLRKDLTYFGQFGTRGLGYKVESLLSQLGSVLRTTRFQPVILVGAGNLGSALLRYDGFAKEGFEIVAVFDIRPDASKAGRTKVPVLPTNAIKRFVPENGVKLAILNFSPLILHVPDHVVVNNVNLAIELENLSYFIA